MRATATAIALSPGPVAGASFDHATKYIQRHRHRQPAALDRHFRTH